ncbi:MAG: FAD-dependent oxidoreductase, partial [Pseudomonadales bacterium]|nr:FAD-dependent oxidoreductase [Pseudomonadales bacterium]
MSKSRFIILSVVVLLVGSFFLFDLGQYLTLETIKAEQDQLNAKVATQPLLAAAIYFVVYIGITALSLPGAAILTLAGGAMFGTWWGLLLVSFASTMGATLAMLVARFLFRQQIEQRFSRQIARFDKGIEKEGAFYLFTLRLIPLFPFFVVNLVMGLTRISVPRYFVISQLGMLPGTFVFVNAGTQLAQISSTSDLLSPSLLLSFALIGLFPLLARRLVDIVKQRKIAARFDRPSRFDRDVIVVGAGSGGLVAALIVATVEGKVTLIEKHKMGGDCLNTGCVPSKSLIRSAKFAADIRRSSDLGFDAMQPVLNFEHTMERVQRVIRAIEPHDSVERYESLGVDVEIGEGRILSPWTVSVNGKVLTTRHIIIATGARPFVPPIRNIDSVDYLTSDNLWDIREQPGRLVVLGGGPIGSELAQAMQRLGSQVTQVEMADDILIREDKEVSQFARQSLEADGVRVLTGHQAMEVINDGEEN